MNAHSMPNLREEAIEDQLHLLWRALPLKNVTDFEGVLKDYQLALGSFTVEAIGNVIAALRCGEIEEASKDFCPKAPKLAEYVRAEQKRIDLLRAPRAIPYTPVNQGFKDWRIIHREKADALKARGYTCISGISLEDMVLRVRRRSVPAGTEWFWSISEAWIPKQNPEGATQ